MANITATIIRPTVSGTISAPNVVGVSIASTQSFPPYEGATEVTPSDDEQVLATAGTNVGSDIIVHPIPSNYGKVSYNGAILFIE